MLIDGGLCAIAAGALLGWPVAAAQTRPALLARLGLRDSRQHRQVLYAHLSVLRAGLFLLAAGYVARSGVVVVPVWWEILALVSAAAAAALLLAAAWLPGFGSQHRYVVVLCCLPSAVTTVGLVATVGLPGSVLCRLGVATVACGVLADPVTRTLAQWPTTAIPQPRRLQQAELDFIMMGCILLGVGLAQSVWALTVPFWAAILLVGGAWLNPALFIPQAWKPGWKDKIWFQVLAHFPFALTTSGSVAVAWIGLR